MRDSHCQNREGLRRPGFTLIELLVVLVVIGVLATLAAVRYDQVREAAWEETLRSDVRSLVKHQELHRMTHETYGTLEEIEQYVSSPGTTIQMTHAEVSGWSATATHPALHDRTCGVFVGDAPPAGGAPATLPEVVECTDG